jgi:electron transport complex protein RnfA
MNTFTQMLLTALMAVTAENIIFAGGIGFSRVLRAARKPKTLGVYAIFVTFFSLVSILFGFLWNPILADNAALIILRPTIFALIVAAVYMVSAYTLKAFFPGFYKQHGQILSPAAINTVVLSMPYVLKDFKLDLPNAVGFALGTGAAFFLAALALAYTLDKYKNNTDMPKAFSGLPAVLIYVGILSMAFAGLTGGKLF